ncbi:hypothetical protein AGABI1DRAFT_115638, partial [Agaricus bisporus var. burnettii JB137-S8]
MSLFSRVLNLLRNPPRCVGRDLEGNRFYELPSVSDDPRRTKRTIEYKDEEDVWNYIGGGKRLPVQWSMWLSHTRPHPSTVEELQQDAERQRRVLANAALIDARDAKERLARLQLEQSLQDENMKRAQIPQPELEHDTSQPISAQENKNTASPSRTEGLPQVDIETESWSPKTFRRGGGSR